MTRDEILRRVAAGELSPDDALPLLDALTPRAADPQTPAWGTADHGAAPAPGATDETPGAEPGPVTAQGVRAVRVKASYRTIEVIADASVGQVAASGNHAVRRDGDTLVVESQENPVSAWQEEFAGRRPGSPGAATGPGFTFADLPRSLAWAKSWFDQRLVVRVNPELPVTIEAVGASVRVGGLESGLTLRVVAGSVKLEKVRGPLDVEAVTSAIKGSAAPSGTGRLSAESSSVKLLLGPGSDVTINATNRMSKVSLPNAAATPLADPAELTCVVGAGRGTLTVDAVMSSVALSADDEIPTRTTEASR